MRPILDLSRSLSLSLDLSLSLSLSLSPPPPPPPLSRHPICLRGSVAVYVAGTVACLLPQDLPVLSMPVAQLVDKLRFKAKSRIGEKRTNLFVISI